MQIKPCDGVLVFTVPDDVAVERLVKRGESSGRADDNEETIRKRMEVFKEESQPVIDALKGSGRVGEIDAQGDPEAIFIEVARFMEQLEGGGATAPAASPEAEATAAEAVVEAEQEAGAEVAAAEVRAVEEAEEGGIQGGAGYTEEEQAAIVKIQAGARGMLGRKRVQKLKEADTGAAASASHPDPSSIESQDKEVVQVEAESSVASQPLAAEGSATLPSSTVVPLTTPGPSSKPGTPLPAAAPPAAPQPVPPSGSKPSTPQPRPASASPRPPSSKPAPAPAAAAPLKSATSAALPQVCLSTGAHFNCYLDQCQIRRLLIVVCNYHNSLTLICPPSDMSALFLLCSSI